MTHVQENYLSQSGLRDASDDLVYRMRNLAGSGDIDAAADLFAESLELLNDASAYDRGLPEDHEDSGVTLGYVLQMMHLVAENAKGVPTGNRSRAARQAA